MFLAAPTKLGASFRNAQQEIILHHPARDEWLTLCDRDELVVGEVVAARVSRQESVK